MSPPRGGFPPPTFDKDNRPVTRGDRVIAFI